MRRGTSSTYYTNKNDGRTTEVKQDRTDQRLAEIATKINANPPEPNAAFVESMHAIMRRAFREGFKDSDVSSHELTYSQRQQLEVINNKHLLYTSSSNIARYIVRVAYWSVFNESDVAILEWARRSKPEEYNKVIRIGLSRVIQAVNCIM